MNTHSIGKVKPRKTDPVRRRGRPAGECTDARLNASLDAWLARRGLKPGANATRMFFGRQMQGQKFPAGVSTTKPATTPTVAADRETAGEHTRRAGRKTLNPPTP